MKPFTARQFITELSGFQTRAELENVQKFFRVEDAKSEFLGIRMSSIFALAKQFKQAPLEEIEKTS